MLSPLELANYMLDVTNKKMNRKFSKIFVSSILAGMFIGLGFYACIVINSYKYIDISHASEGILKFLGAFVFAVGLIMVLIAGADLFTGNCLVMFGCFKGEVKFTKVVCHLLIVILGNFLGGLILAFLIYVAKAPNDAIIAEIMNICEKKYSHNFLSSLILGFLCNIMVAIAVYMSYAAKTVSGKVIIVILPIIAFILMSFEHSVANMFILPLNAMLQRDGILQIINNLIPVILGNFLGGGIFLPLAYTFLYLNE